MTDPYPAKKMLYRVMGEENVIQLTSFSNLPLFIYTGEDGVSVLIQLSSERSLQYIFIFTNDRGTENDIRYNFSEPETLPFHWSPFTVSFVEGNGVPKIVITKNAYETPETNRRVFKTPKTVRKEPKPYDTPNSSRRLFTDDDENDDDGSMDIDDDEFLQRVFDNLSSDSDPEQEVGEDNNL